MPSQYRDSDIASRNAAATSFFCAHIAKVCCTWLTAPDCSGDNTKAQSLMLMVRGPKVVKTKVNSARKMGLKRRNLPRKNHNDDAAHRSKRDSAAITKSVGVS